MTDAKNNETDQTKRLLTMLIAACLALLLWGASLHFRLNQQQAQIDQLTTREFRNTQDIDMLQDDVLLILEGLPPLTR